MMKRLMILFSIVFLFGCSPSKFLKGFFSPETFGEIYIIRVHAEPTDQALNISLNKKLVTKVENGDFIALTVATGKQSLSFDWPPVGVLLPKSELLINVKEHQSYYFLVNHINKNTRSRFYKPDLLLSVISSADTGVDNLSVKLIHQKEALIIIDSLKKAKSNIQNHFDRNPLN